MMALYVHLKKISRYVAELFSLKFLPSVLLQESKISLWEINSRARWQILGPEWKKTVFWGEKNAKQCIDWSENGLIWEKNNTTKSQHYFWVCCFVNSMTLVWDMAFNKLYICTANTFNFWASIVVHYLFHSLLETWMWCYQIVTSSWL